jgi:hypothetical protein
VNGHRLRPGECTVILASDEVRIGRTIITIAKVNPNTCKETFQDQPPQTLHEPALI